MTAVTKICLEDFFREPIFVKSRLVPLFIGLGVEAGKGSVCGVAHFVSCTRGQGGV